MLQFNPPGNYTLHSHSFTPPQKYGGRIGSVIENIHGLNYREFKNWKKKPYKDNNQNKKTKGKENHTREK